MNNSVRVHSQPIYFPKFSMRGQQFRHCISLTARDLSKLQPQKIGRLVASAIERSIDEGLSELVIEDIMFFAAQADRKTSSSLNVIFQIIDGYLNIAAQNIGLSCDNTLCLRYGNKYDVRCVLSGSIANFPEFDGGYLEAA